MSCGIFSKSDLSFLASIRISGSKMDMNLFFIANLFLVLSCFPFYSYGIVDFQKEISPEDLERKWSKLSRILGGVKRVKNAVVSSRGAEQQLVLVTIEFGTVTDNLFVIFDAQGRIINVDFSEDLV